MKTKKCDACGNDFEPPPHKASMKYCDRPVCQEAKVLKRKAREKIRKISDGAGLHQPMSRSMKKAPVRLCRSCGKNAYPNYFFCPACHHKVCGEETVECKEWAERGFF